MNIPLLFFNRWRRLLKQIVRCNSIYGSTIRFRSCCWLPYTFMISCATLQHIDETIVQLGLTSNPCSNYLYATVHDMFVNVSHVRDTNMYKHHTHAQTTSILKTLLRRFTCQRMLRGAMVSLITSLVYLRQVVDESLCYLNSIFI